MKQHNERELNATGRKILSTAGRSRYDTEAINLLKDKQFLAWILHDCVEEYAGMTREEIIPYIEDVYSAEVHVAPGLDLLNSLDQIFCLGQSIIYFHIYS